MDSLSGQLRLDIARSGARRAPSLSAPIICETDAGAVALAGKVRLGDRPVASAADAEHILRAYLQSGSAVLSSLTGPYAIVISSVAQQTVLAAVDRMGIGRLAWAWHDHALTVDASAESVAERAYGRATIEPQAMFDFMLGHMVPAPRTLFHGVQKLAPGTAIEVDADGARTVRHRQPDFGRPPGTDIAELRDAVLPTLTRAIERTAPDAATGAFLSGGLDSSTVAGLLTRVNPDSANAFSVGFGVAEFDEMAYADAASSHFGCRHFKYEVTADDIVAAIPKIAATYDEPFGNSSAVPTYYCAKLARDNGVTHLLAGDGGDEIFGGNERYVRHKVFEIYSKLPGFIRRGLLEPMARKLDPEASVFPLRKFASYVQQATIPLPERFESWNLIYREGPSRVFDTAFLDIVDPRAPLQHMADVWNACPSDDLLDRMLWYDWHFTLADSDIRKVSTMSALAGVDVSYPMLDEEFVDLSIRVPSGAKIVGQDLRKFFRDAVRDFLPRAVIQKQKHGFGLPFGQWLKTHGELQSLVYGSLDGLRERGIFDSAFISRVAEEHRDGHASYYGYAIWDLVMLEQWFRHHVAPDKP